MRTSSKLLLLSALLAFGSAACGDFLSGPGLTTDPNTPSSASRDQRLAAVQANMTQVLTGDLARAACMWVQQCAGVDRQYAAYEVYNINSVNFDPDYLSVYTGGGLIDLRAIEADAAASGDSVYEGVGKVLEGLLMSTTADLWGDNPYADAVGSSLNPKYDTQQSMYTALLTLLDQAIAELGGPGAGPGGVDLWLLGDKVAWREFAHTLKARIYLHLAERNGAPAYTSALAEANQGISTAAHNVATWASTTTSENNFWFQFQVTTGRDTYLRMGAALEDSIMRKRNDPRLPAYFTTVTPPAWAHSRFSVRPTSLILDPNGNFEQATAVTGDDSSGTVRPTFAATVGATTVDNHVTWTNIGPLPYAGAAPGDAFNPAIQSNVSATRLSAGYRQPLATQAEVQLIVAEAAHQTGDDATALASLNAERTAAGLSALTGITGTALLDSIMIEKYVALFQNIESWNDYKRTCIPALVPAGPAAGGKVIGRVLYGATEAATNTNFPGDPPNALNPLTGRNWNDPNPCP